MKTTSSILLGAVLPLLATASTVDRASFNLGCFSAVPDSYTDEGSYSFQSIGYCSNLCDKQGKKYAATQDEHCWCGDADPVKDDLADDDQCDVECPGYAGDMCGGEDSWSVYGFSGLTPESWESTSSAAVPASTTTVSESETSTETEDTATSTSTSHAMTSSTGTAETSTTAPSSSTPLWQGAAETPSSTTTSLEYTPTGNSASRRYSFLF